MSTIVLADDGIRFDGRTLSTRPLGGAETAVVNLAEALAARGHEVTVVNRCAAAHVINGVDWRPITDGFPGTADLYIANRGDKLLDRMREARICAFWIHNPAGYLVKWRYLIKLWRRRPQIVFSGTHHLATCPVWCPDGGRHVIPLGIERCFLESVPDGAVPARRAIFTSNPLRGLDWLLALWTAHIHPRVPDAELHIFSGRRTYGAIGDAKAARMDDVLARAADLSGSGVVLRAPVPKTQLAAELAGARVMPYRGDVGETFCLALAEAQAMGVPCVVQPIGCVSERIIEGETGYVRADDDAFAERVVALLSDDALWRARHTSALKHQRGWTWDRAAAAFEDLIS